MTEAMNLVTTKRADGALNDLGAYATWKKANPDAATTAVDLSQESPATPAAPLLNKQNTDVVFNDVGITPERQKAYLFATPYLYAKTVLIKRTDETHLNTLADLKGKKMAQSTTSNFGALAKKSGPQTITPGTLTIGLEGTFAPFSYRQNGQLTGFEVDLSTAIAKKLGLKPKYVQTKWDSLIAGLGAKR
ncbi:transporter substrate-binding domain-containing protein|uniref:Transporter substrate-binding domain-containing protein n=1 Tax=Leuconostoc lactis TaxID=1246 RepID=A0A6L7A8L1_LEULA|nr:transporter substrate-binding domain-containing protein [Leuconostoc lactis]